MPPPGRAHWAVWEVIVNSCWEEGCFIVSSQAQRLRQTWSPDHTHGAAGNGCSRHCIQLRRSPGSPFRDDATRKETQEAPRTAGKIPTNQRFPIANCSIQCLVQQTKPKNPEPTASPTQELPVKVFFSQHQILTAHLFGQTHGPGKKAVNETVPVPAAMELTVWKKSPAIKLVIM